MHAVQTQQVSKSAPAVNDARVKQHDRYAKCVEVSKRIRWDIDKDVIRGRKFDFDRKFLPDGISKLNGLEFLNDNEKRLLSQIQGRTYANMFGLVERFICAKVLELSHQHFFGDQVALEALVRFSDEELKHQELFRRIEAMTAEGMVDGYRFLPQPNEVASVVLGKSTWAVLALTLHIELFTQAHYQQSLDKDTEVSELYKDVFYFHWKEESQHAIMDALEWEAEDSKLSDRERDQAVDDLIELVAAVDAIVQAQAKTDAEYFVSQSAGRFSDDQVEAIQDCVLKAYRWQYIVSGVEQEKFISTLCSLVNEQQMQRIVTALQPIMNQTDN